MAFHEKGVALRRGPFSYGVNFNLLQCVSLPYRLMNKENNHAKI
jgi:hypothetical protein